MKKFFFVLVFSPLFFSLNEVRAYTSSDVLNATFLATEGAIVKQLSTSGYRLDDTITRAEAVGIALKIKKVLLPNNYTCKNYFIDAPYNPNNNWICRAVELAKDNGIVSGENIKARPSDPITRSEVLAIFMYAALNNSLSIVPKGYKFSTDTVEWQQNIFYAAEDLISVTGTKYDYLTRPISVNYFPNRNATRAEVFEFARNIFEKKEAEIPEVTSFNKDVVETINKVSEGFDIVLIDKYDAHFGDNDVEPLVIKVRFNYGKKLVDLVSEYTGFSIGTETIYANKWFLTGCDMGGSSSYAFYTQDYSFEIPGCIFDAESAVNDIQIKFTNQQILKSSDVLRIYYKILGSDDILPSYNMRSPSGVSLETFESWYKNVTSVVFREDTLKDLGNSTFEFLVDMTENGTKGTYKVKSKVDLENFKINNISSVKQ